MSLDILFSKLKGGTGSGNFGHSGRPGKHGGSSPGGGGGVSSGPLFDRSVSTLEAAIESEHSGEISMAGSLYEASVNKDVDMGKALDTARNNVIQSYKKDLSKLSTLGDNEGRLNVFDNSVKKVLTESRRKPLLNQGYIDRVDLRNFRISDKGKNLIEGN